MIFSNTDCSSFKTSVVELAEHPSRPSLKTDHGCTADQTVRLDMRFEDTIRPGILFSGSD